MSGQGDPNQHPAGPNPIVRSRQCPTCPFRRTPERLRRTRERLDEIRVNQLTGHFHICHTEGLDLHHPEAPDILCKAAFDYCKRQTASADFDKESGV